MTSEVKQLCNNKAKIIFSLTFISDTPEGIKSNIKIFANDDTSIILVINDNMEDSAILNEDMNLIFLIETLCEKCFLINIPQSSQINNIF